MVDATSDVGRGRAGVQQYGCPGGGRAKSPAPLRLHTTTALPHRSMLPVAPSHTPLHTPHTLSYAPHPPSRRRAHLLDHCTRPGASVCCVSLPSATIPFAQPPAHGSRSTARAPQRPRHLTRPYAVPKSKLNLKCLLTTPTVLLEREGALRRFSLSHGSHAGDCADSESC